MKLYNSIGPNPKVVRMFIQELNLEVETINVDLMAGENRQSDHLSRNPKGQLPTLALDNGSYLSEITAICEYLDEKSGHTDLIGRTAEDRAAVRMWARRIDLNILEPIGSGFRYGEGLALFESRMRTMPQAAEDLKTLAQEQLSWLESEMHDKTYVCGSRFTLADILLFCFLEFGSQAGQALNIENSNIMSWFERVKERPSAAA